MDFEDQSDFSDPEDCFEDDDYNDYVNDEEEEAYNNKAISSQNIDNQNLFLPLEEIFQRMNSEINEVKDVIQTSSTLTRIFLNKFNWRKESLYENFYSEKSDELFQSLKMFDQNEKKLNNNNKKDPSLRLECGICFLDFKSCDMMALECEHIFCLECWQVYLTTKIVDEGITDSITCPGHDCKFLTDDEKVMNLVTEESVKCKYTNLITNTYVECNRSLNWCPTPQCTYVIKIDYGDPMPIKCVCKAKLCSTCGNHWHAPIECDMLKSWIKKIDSDGKTSMWIATNTKFCPKCKTTIEKNGGCNHMSCSNKSCGHQFCWNCLQDYKHHSDCNKFEEKIDGDQSRAEMLRLSFYSGRYSTHDNSLKFENRLYEKLNLKKHDQMTKGICEIYVQFLDKAAGVLCKCRQVLMYTYAFAFYLSKNPHSVIFENNQADLERAIEILSDYLENQIDKQEVLDIKEAIINNYIYCEQRCHVLLEHVYEGRRNNIWKITK